MQNLVQQAKSPSSSNYSTMSWEGLDIPNNNFLKHVKCEFLKRRKPYGVSFFDFLVHLEDAVMREGGWHTTENYTTVIVYFPKNKWLMLDIKYSEM